MIREKKLAPCDDDVPRAADGEIKGQQDTSKYLHRLAVAFPPRRMLEPIRPRLPIALSRIGFGDVGPGYGRFGTFGMLDVGHDGLAFSIGDTFYGVRLNNEPWKESRLWGGKRGDTNIQ